VLAATTRFQHYLRQLALLMAGRAPQYALASAGRRQRRLPETLAELSHRRRRAQIAARRALDL
jgi:hypothetical protein